MVQYRYYKRSDDRDGEARMILREPLKNGFELQCWRIDRWESASDFWWQTRQECDYWDIPEDEALGELESLGRRQIAATARREREDAMAREKILRERQHAWDSRAGGDSWTALGVSAIALHELFMTFVEAGFTEDQALTLVSRLVLESKDSHGRGEVGG